MESTDGYLILQDWFIGAVTRPMYRAWLKMAVAAGEIKLPRGLDMASLYSAVYSGPVMPWIDPVKRPMPGSYRSGAERQRNPTGSAPADVTRTM
ncbi:hypothetical protein [Citrobacter freundii]|uniref:hypothetical protein n=1 Tax=Citrobacter freundii TaxID=546 RepID=UPI001E55063C|nr:hypothetical protein [Citrobacter freundii]